MLALDRFDFEDIVKLGPRELFRNGRHLELITNPSATPKKLLIGVVIVATDVSESMLARRDWETMREKVDFFARVMPTPAPFRVFQNTLWEKLKNSSNKGNAAPKITRAGCTT